MVYRNVAIAARAVDANNNPVRDIVLTFKYRVSGASEWTTVGTATTDMDGVATYVVVLPVPGTYDFRVDFDGNYDYEPAYAEVNDVRIRATLRIGVTVTPG